MLIIGNNVLEVKDADRNLVRLLSRFPPEAPTECGKDINVLAKLLKLNKTY